MVDHNLLGSTGHMTTPLYVTIRKRVDDAVDQLVRQQVTPWSFLTAGPPFRIKTIDGGQIAYEGVTFEGSPRQVFWSRYIEPFLEDLCLTEITAAVSMAKERGVDAKLLLPELQGLLCAGIQRVYERMAEVDRRLRGKGFPETAELKPIGREIAAMNQFLEAHFRAELAMWKPKSRVEEWYERNKFWVWAIPIALSIVGLWTKFG